MAGKVLRDYLEEARTFLTAPATKGAPPLELKASDAMRATYAVQAGIPQYPPREYRALLASYRKNPIVRSATLKCAQAVASIEPVVKVAGNEEHPEALWVAEWLKRPNPAQNRFAYIRDLAAFKKLAGNAWSEGVPGMLGRYLEAYALRPERMHVIPGANGWPAGYEYDSGNGRKVRWKADFEGEKSRLLHVKDFSTDNDYFGSGALEAAEGALALYDNAQALARYMFENGMITSGILSYDPQTPAGQSPPSLTEEQRTRLQTLIDEFKKGGKRAGKVMIAPASLKYQPMSTTMVDLQAEEIRNQAKRDIALAFEIPPMLLGIPGDNTYSNFQEASRAFYRNSVIPDAMVLFESLAQWLGQLLHIPQLTIEFDEDDMWALAEELNLRTQRILGNDTLSVEEQRDALGWSEQPPPGQMARFNADMMQMLAQDLARPEPKRIGGPKRDE